MMLVQTLWHSVEMLYGEAMTKANRKPVLSQLIALSDTWKKWDAVLDTAEKVNHYQVSAQSKWMVRPEAYHIHPN